MNYIFEETVLNWVLIMFAAFVIGLAKSGIKGIEMMNITIMAIVFGGKASTGVVLPLLCFADIMAVKKYHPHAQGDYFLEVLSWVVLGGMVGGFICKKLN